MTEFYPVNDYGPIMPGLIMAGVATLHVFLAQFAVGGGFLLCYFQWLAMSGKNEYARKFVNGYFKVLVLISFVLGAVTGVGIWFTAIQISAPTIGEMVFNFHWIWATEWTFFCLEIVAGYCFYRYQHELTDRSALTLLGLYTFAAWMSLFWINGIISWQLTPGNWLETKSVYDGLFNPGFWPSLLFRSVACLTIASLVACVLVNAVPAFDRDARHSLINRSAHLMIPMILMPFLGAWFLITMPEDSRGWVLGGSPAMMMFLAISIAASVAIGAYALIGMYLQRLFINGATATLLLLLAFGASVGGEFVREGSRKPYSIRHVLFSNAIHPDEVAELREIGSVTNDPYPLINEENYPTDQIRLGAKVFRRQCAVCHTMGGTNAVGHLTASWDKSQLRMNLAKLQQIKPFMPPFAGSAPELEALVQYILWHNAKRPPDWHEQLDPDTLTQIEQWLAEAGTEAADQKNNTGSEAE